MEEASSAPHHGSWGLLRHLKRERGVRWAKGRAREGGASERWVPGRHCGSQGHAGLCAGHTRREVTGAPTTEGPGSCTGVPLRELQALGPEPSLRLCSAGVLFPSESSEFAQRPSWLPSPRACHPLGADVSVHPGPSRSFRGSLASQP